jgi:hypothetical protein
MAKTHYIPRPAFSLKEAYTQLIEACGGCVHIADAVRVSSSQLHRYTDPALDDCHMPLDIVLALETMAKKPFVTLFMAQKHGWEMTPAKAQSDQDLAGLTAELGFEHAELSACVLTASADHEITPAEARLIAAEAADVQAKASQVIAQADALANPEPKQNCPPTDLKAVS